MSNLKEVSEKLGAYTKIFPLIALIGLIGSVFGATKDSHQFYFSYLTSFVFFLGLALGALFFVLIHHATRAGWSVVVRRIAENMLVSFPILFLLFIPIFFGMHDLFHWTHESEMAKDAILQGKQGYLNQPFFIGRALFYFVCWLALGYLFYSKSVAQDDSKDSSLSLTLQKWSYLGIFIFAMTISFAAFDWLMSLDPHWFSTIFGVYYFSGSFLSAVALMAIIAIIYKSKDLVGEEINTEHLHDLGKWMFAFTIFWSYIGFSQFFLIWCANIPEETAWFLKRWQNGFKPLSLLILFGKFIIPFLFLLTRHTKRGVKTLFGAAIWILFMQFVDIYWLVMPTRPAPHNNFHPHFLDAAAFLFIGGVFLTVVFHFIKKSELIPVSDPRLKESLKFENQ